MLSDQQIAQNAILIVTGSSLRAEQADRPLAYHLKQCIEELPNADGDTLNALVLSDLWYLNSVSLQKMPTIAIGGPGVNAVSAHFSRRLHNLLVVENALVIQLDPEFQDLRASIWGVDHETTINALEIFQQRGYLTTFIQTAMAKMID